MIFLQYVGKEIAMKISPQILKMRLETWGFGLSGNVPGRGMYLGRPVFYTETENEEEERLYILPGGTRLPDRAGTKREKRQTRGAACPDPCRKRCADFRQKEVRINTAGKRCVHGLQLQEMQPGRHADFVPGDPTATEACDSFVRERQGLNVFP